MRTVLFVTLAILLVAVTPRPVARVPVRPGKEAHVSFQLTSSAFTAQGAIPRRHTCQGEDLSPPLAWSGNPTGTKSLALIVDDPDAPLGTWVHWVIYDLPPAATALPEGVTAPTLPVGTREGLNGWKQAGWRGPCPPTGRHRYFHKLYALDIVLPDLHQPTAAALERAMAGHVLAQAELVGTYQRSH
jgi:Raf kinase inhibitor-like YbhB/YbcL family protein